MRTILLGLVVAALGCGGSSGEPTMCAGLSGLYRFQATAESGNCGAMADTIVDVGSPSTCTGPQSVSPNGCEVTSDLSCPDAMTGQTTLIRGKLIGSADGRTASATIAIEVYAQGALVCSGVYSARYTAL